MEKLRAVYKNTMLITRERKKSVSEESKSLKGEIRKKSKLDLFKDFYEAYGNSDYNDKKDLTRGVIYERIGKLAEKLHVQTAQRSAALYEWPLRY